jgi:hypothetical protein
MPSRKRRLNRADQAQFLNSVRALYVAGFNMEISEELLEDSRALDIAVAEGPASSVFESSRGTFYATDTCLVARQPCTLLNCRMLTDWDEHIVLRSFDDETCALPARCVGLSGSKCPQPSNRKWASVSSSR